MKDNLEFLLPRILFLLWLWLFAIVVFTGWPRLWGMIPLGPTEGDWALPVALICTVMIFGPGAGLFAWVNKWLTYSKKNINRRSVRLIGLVFLYLTIFFIAWILRSENHFMGDGWLYISEVEKPFYLSITRPLDFFIHQLFHRIVQVLGLGGGEAAYALLHCFLCPVFLWTCWNIAGLITSDFLGRAVLGLLMASTTVLQLFVGYVECYTLLNLWVVIYIYTGIKYLCNRQNVKNPWVPTIIFVLVFFSHRSGVVLGPSLLFLWLYRLLPGRSTNNKLFNPFFLVALIFPLPLVFGLITKSPSVSLLVPLWGPNANSQAPYSLFSIEHLWEKLNFLMLICPAAVVALPVITSKWRLLKRWDNSSFIFVFWCCAGSVFFSFILNPLLGIRDWDLLSISGVPLALFSGWCLLTVLKKGRSRDAFLRALAVAATVHGMAWVWVNADIDRGVAFLDHIDMRTITRAPGN